jgi:hypothetical protein
MKKGEKCFKELLNKDFPKIFEYQFKVDKYTLDFYSEKYSIIIEIDECAHLGFDQYKEYRRMVDIREKLNKRLVFIRFCPELLFYFPKGCKFKFSKRVCTGRYFKAKYFIQKIMKIKTLSKTSIIYMYYCRNVPIICKKLKYNKIKLLNKAITKKINELIEEKYEFSMENLKIFCKKIFPSLYRSMYEKIFESIIF